VLLLALLGCRTGLSNGVIEKDDTRYFVGAIPRGWTPQQFADNDLFFGKPDGHSIAVNATCRGYGDAPLDVLTRHLVEGFTDVEPLDRKTASIDGREALFTHYQARLDGVPIEMLLVVMKKDGCVYDFSYLSPPGHFDDDRAVFEALLARFRTEEKK
jgi:hypothetical protein